MSTGLECEFVPVTTSTPSPTTVWFYILENWNAPKMAWDWREYATAYGPFASYEEADAHLTKNHPNPGGHMICDPVTEPDRVLADLIKGARK